MRDMELTDPGVGSLSLAKESNSSYQGGGTEGCVARIVLQKG